MSKKVQITAIENGPFQVTNLKSLTYLNEKLEVGDENIYLCRCGESANMPYCDGTHRQNGFSSAKTRSETKEPVIWEGSKIRTRFDPNVCMHVYYCKPLKELRLKEVEESGNAAALEIARVVSSCPSGALTYEYKTELADTVPGDRPQMEIIEGGEIRLQTDYECIDFVAAEKQPEDRATLCRCGLSDNKPFCDGQHRTRENFR